MSEDYKSKYDDLMKRCADFMRDFAPPSPYELGFKAGWEAAKKEFHKDNTYVPDTTKPAKTMDIQWPRDYQTTPFPTTHLNRLCSTCGIDLNKNYAYVCVAPDCPTQIRVTCATSTQANIYSLSTESIPALSVEQIQKLKGITK